MSVLIKTKMIQPTDYNGTRVFVSCLYGRVYVPWDYEINSIREQHLRAVAVLMKAISPRRIAGDFAMIENGKGDGYFLVPADTDHLVTLQAEE